nr:arabinose-5-phosphate isomerase GutQ [Blochmannia endosymbiont of Polyrhachis (Hedomyrma) turneri]
MNEKKLLDYAKETLLIEISEAKKMLMRLNDSIVLACRILLNCSGKVIVSGIGKSGHIAQKIAASLASTGTPSFFMHLADALHGDLGMIDVKDVVIFISYSGQACELDTLIPLLSENCIPIIALTGNSSSSLAKAASCVLDIKIEREACPMKLVPTSSVVNALMMGDALTITLMRQKEFSVDQFARFHPGGRLGAKLYNRVSQVMRVGGNIAKVCLKVTVMDAMCELNRTGLGLTAVCDPLNNVVGVFTDGDLRRWLVAGKSLSDPIVKAMTVPGYLLEEDCRAFVAMTMFHKNKIHAAPVVDIRGKLVGMINSHDFHQLDLN